MNRRTCQTCTATIPAGEAHLRSVAFVQVAYCSPLCVELAGVEAATVADVIARHNARVA